MKSSTKNGKNQASENISLLITVLALILLAVILAIGEAIWNDYRDKIMDNQKDQLLDTSRILAADMELTLDEYGENLIYLSGLPRETAEEYSAYLESKNGIERNIILEAADGSDLLNAAGEELQELIEITRIDEKRSIWQGTDGLGVHCLVFRQKEEDGSALCLVIDEDAFYRRLMSGIRIGTNGYIMVKNSGGIILMHPDQKQWGIHVIEGRKKIYPDLDYTSLQTMVEEQNAGQTGITEYYSYWWTEEPLQLVKKISAFAHARVGDDFWVISSVIDYDDFIRPVEAGFKRVSILFIISLVLASLLFISVGTLIYDRRRTMEKMQSLRELNERLETIHKGEELMLHQQRLQIVGTMTGGIAHEFNNLLTPIMGYADLLMEELADDPEACENAREIYVASEKAKDVITQISSLSRKNVETVFHTLEADRLLERVWKMMVSICPENIRVEKHLACGKTCFLGNATQITQVLLNLTMNAFHAIADREGTVSLGSAVISRTQLGALESMKNTVIPDDWSRYIRIDLTDDGCGMSPEVLSRCFTPFFTTKRAGEGTGLGLALAEQMILSHRGYILAESEPERGSSFHIFLPALDVPEDGRVSPGKLAENRKLLIADDNLKILNLLEKAFAKHAVEVFTCSNKKRLLQLLEEEKPDVLLVDEVLEDGSGLDLCMSIQGLYPRMRKVIMADYPTDQILEAKQKGVIHGYLLKPVSDRTILDLLNNVKEVS